MVTLYSKIIGSSVIEMARGEKVGTVFELIYDLEKLSIAGIVLEKNILNRTTFVISQCNIVELLCEENVVLIDEEESVLSINELVRLKDRYKTGTCGIGQRVNTKSGQYVGKVYDILIDGLSFEIKKFYIKGLFSERIVSRDSVLDFQPRKITIKDNFQTARVKAVIETSLV